MDPVPDNIRLLTDKFVHVSSFIYDIKQKHSSCFTYFDYELRFKHNITNIFKYQNIFPWFRMTINVRFFYCYLEYGITKLRLISWLWYLDAILNLINRELTDDGESFLWLEFSFSKIKYVLYIGMHFEPFHYKFYNNLALAQACHHITTFIVIRFKVAY
jgi:hypothetical protein